MGPVPAPRIEKEEVFEGLDIQHLSWSLPFGPRTRAFYLRPRGHRGKLPGVLALHCHGGIKTHGAEKIARGRKDPGAYLHGQIGYYDKVFWANELAKRGYAVLAHDVYAFGSRRVRVADVPPEIRWGCPTRDPKSAEEFNSYNRWASSHESVMAKSLFSAGTTWPGVVLAEDRRALDILERLPGVDPRRLACCGLSGGGLRTVYLAGLDKRVSCAVDVGFMTTWKDQALSKGWTHTWMTFAPGIPALMDFPEILGLRAPKPALVLNCLEDRLFSLPEMRRSDKILREIYRKARAPRNYRTEFFPGPHQFNIPMQARAAAWFDRWL